MADEHSHAPEPDVDWQEVARELTQEHVARLAADAAIANVKLASALARLRDVTHLYERLAVQVQPLSERADHLDAENAGLQARIAELELTAKPLPARKAAPRGRR